MDYGPLALSHDRATIRHSKSMNGVYDLYLSPKNTARGRWYWSYMQKETKYPLILQVTCQSVAS